MTEPNIGASIFVALVICCITWAILVRIVPPLIKTEQSLTVICVIQAIIFTTVIILV